MTTSTAVAWGFRVWWECVKAEAVGNSSRRTGVQNNGLNTSYLWIWDYYYHFFSFEDVGKSNKLCKTWAWHSCSDTDGSSEPGSSSRLDSTLSALVRGSFVSPNLSSLMCDPLSKNPAVSEIYAFPIMFET